MKIPPLDTLKQGGLVGLIQPKADQKPIEFVEKSAGLPNDHLNLSESARQKMKEFTANKAPASLYTVIPPEQRPTAEQSADVILGFISVSLQSRAAQGASDKQMQQTLDQALKGFNKGFSDAVKILEGFGLMNEDLKQSLADTKSLVLNGLNALRNDYLPDDDTDANTNPVIGTTSVVKTVEAYSQSSTEISTVNSAERSTANRPVQSAAAYYAESYKSNGSVQMALQTNDGDTITLNFSSRFAISSSSSFLANTNINSSNTDNSNLPDTAFNSVKNAANVAKAYQTSVSSNTQFNFSVQGELDAGEVEALNALLKQVAELSNEFFNGDFDAALAMAGEFELNTDEFSVFTLDVARSTSASVVQAYTTSSDVAGSVPLNSTSGLDAIEQMLNRLKELAESAQSFGEPKSLISNLLANQVAQHSLLAPSFQSDSTVSLLDKLLSQVN